MIIETLRVTPMFWDFSFHKVLPSNFVLFQWCGVAHVIGIRDKRCQQRTLHKRLSEIQWQMDGWVSTSINHTPRLVTRLVHSWFAPWLLHKITCSVVSLSCWHWGHQLWSPNLHVNCILLTPQKWLICLDAQSQNIPGNPAIMKLMASQSTRSKPAVDIRKWSGHVRKVFIALKWILHRICFARSEVHFTSSIQRLHPSNLIVLSGGAICLVKSHLTLAFAPVSIN